LDPPIKWRKEEVVWVQDSKESPVSGENQSSEEIEGRQ